MHYFFESTQEIEIRERKNLDYPAHLQERLEMGYIEEGSVILSVDGKQFPLQRGELFIVFPNQIHSYAQSNGLLAKIMIFSPDLIAEYKNPLSSQIPCSPIVSDPGDAKKVMDLLFQVKTEDAAVLRGFLLALFGLLLEKMPLRSVDKYNISSLKNLLTYCSEHFQEGITISDASKAVHLNRYYISHIFKEKLHTTFKEYITQKQISYACRLLAEGQYTVTEIAYRSGFNSVRSFNRNFLNCLGISPKEYKQRNLRSGNTNGGK